MGVCAILAVGLVAILAVGLVAILAVGLVAILAVGLVTILAVGLVSVARGDFVRGFPSHLLRLIAGLLPVVAIEVVFDCKSVSQVVERVNTAPPSPLPPLGDHGSSQK